MEGKTSEQTNGPGALVLPLAWRHNFWQFYRIVVLVLPRIGSDRVGLSLPTPHFWVLAFVEHKTHLNSIRMWHFCIFFLFSWLCCCCCVRWHFGTLINVAKLFGGGGRSHWTLKSNSDSTFSSVFFFVFPDSRCCFPFGQCCCCLFFVSFHCYPKWLHYLYRLFHFRHPSMCSLLAFFGGNSVWRRSGRDSCVWLLPL